MRLTPVVLAYAVGETCESIAEIMGCAVGTVKSRVSRARKALHGILEAGDAHHCMLELGAESVEALLALMALVGPDFEILDDRGLLPQLREASSRLGQALSPA